MVTLGKLANELAIELCGNGEETIEKCASIDNNAHQGCLCYCDKKPTITQSNTQATAVITSKDHANLFKTNVLISESPRLSWAKALKIIYPNDTVEHKIEKTAFVEETALIDRSAYIGQNVYIGKNVTIGKNTKILQGCVICNNVKIQENCIIYPNVTIYNECVIKSNVIIHSGAVIGADGFGFEFDRANMRWEKINQIGHVIIGEDVEIGANTTIDRGSINPTIIGNGAKLDNLVMVAHNVQIGDFTVIAGCTAIAGSTKIGKYCLIGGASSISDHIEICDNVRLAGGAIVRKSIHNSGSYASGTCLLPIKKWHKCVAIFRNLDSIRTKLRNLKEMADSNQK